MSKAFHVPVVIDAVDWDAGRVWLEASALPPDLPFDQLCKSPDYTLLALDQESLITAARARFPELGEENPWWIVDVYVTTSGPSTATQTLLAWLLTQIKVNLDLLIRSLFARFEKISTKNDFPATGASTKVFVSTKARLRVFYNLVGGQVDLLSQIDAMTVHLLQSRAPGVSARDLNFLRLKQNRLFKYIDCERDRDAIWQRMERIHLPIPTLKTFFQDILFLDVGQSVMRQLCRSPLTATRSIDQALEEQYIVESGGLGYNLSRISGSRFRSGLWNLWRFSHQFAFELTTQKDHHRRVPRKMEDIERAQEYGLHEIPIAEMVPSLRFHFFGLARLHGIHPSVSVDDTERAISEIPLQVQSDFPLEEDQDVDLERRCGKPFTDSIEADRYALSESLAHPTIQVRVSAVSVRQSVFNAFFSYLLP
ncbi:uncharacterized protein N7458_005968 [Penicillium daleae]|uniref:Uncharacterized protein n=1 Tax=Penicillium daleae TaxID=63821 RepID=A0AAD6C4J0_9EURO|nr:uncharacterized protein N7458_005968 [Penicillium daleae]KAJ5449519.1 hypothetical protein N7458_005968 [Penicillium daleae]